MTRLERATITTAAALLLALGASAAHADTTVQIPLAGLLDTRSVFTLTNGTIVPFTLAIDGGNGDVGTGAQNGFATKAVAMMKSPSNVANALPDDGHFPADADHPDVVLSFSNTADAMSPQNHLVKPMVGATPPETFTFPVPSATYSKFFLFFHGADNGTTVKITLTYSDATTDVTNAIIPDFYNAPTDAKVFVLAPDLAKWTKTTTIAEANHHNIFGVALAPMAKTLSTVKVERGPAGYLVFWGATGVATSAVAALDGGAGDAVTTGAGGSDAGAPGSAGASGGAGATGSAGASGGAGATGSAGASGNAGATGSAGATSGGAGASGTAGSAGGTAGAGVVTKPSSSSGCSVGGSSPRASWLALGIVGVSLLGRRRRRRR
ncbi:MAG TPA: MYXO-CTERM sorting domain-containing protein [Polyangia bacterium]|nr:MYXO-CTERM sorting domain-containing protein [Polyangia bacterium]